MNREVAVPKTVQGCTQIGENDEMPRVIDVFQPASHRICFGILVPMFESFARVC
jgi:hypothetical protein